MSEIVYISIKARIDNFEEFPGEIVMCVINSVVSYKFWYKFIWNIYSHEVDYSERQWYPAFWENFTMLKIGKAIYQVTESIWNQNRNLNVGEESDEREIIGEEFNIEYS